MKDGGCGLRGEARPEVGNLKSDAQKGDVSTETSRNSKEQSRQLQRQPVAKVAARALRTPGGKGLPGFYDQG